VCGLHPLDGARALAVILVLIDHFRVFDYFSDGHPKTGSLGVMISFVLSAFLITSMLLKEYRQTGKSHSGCRRCRVNAGIDGFRKVT
jgi:peptidoglycan/LPS O-acetylase OafA/YrhL